MSSEAEDLAKASSLAEYLRDLYSKMEIIDGLLHPAMEDVKLRLVALGMAEDPELQARRREAEARLASGQGFDVLPDDVLQAHL